MAYVATGVREIKRGWPILLSADQRSSEVHVVIGAAGDGLRLVRAGGRAARGPGGLLTTLVSDQFNADAPAVWDGDEMTSGGSLGVVAQTAKKSAATKMLAGDLDTQPLCGWRNRTQVV